MNQVSPHTLAIKFTFLFLVFATAGCKNITEIDRNNRNDPFSRNYVPIPNSNETLTIEKLSLKSFQIKWPKYIGVSKYNLYRKSSLNTAFSLISEKKDFNDTTYIDNLNANALYTYKLEVIANNGNTSTLLSESTLNNLIKIGSLPIKDDSGAPIYTQINTEGKVFLSRLNEYSRNPDFTIYDLERKTLKNLQFSNYTFNHQEYLRTDHIFPINEDQFLIFYIYKSRSSGGWGSRQNFLGLVCSFNTEDCFEVGENNLPEDERFEETSFIQLNPSELLITSARVHGSTFRGNIAYKMSLIDFTFSEISAPLNDLVPLNFTKFENKTVLGCSHIMLPYKEPLETKCQTFDIQTEQWSYTNDIPIEMGYAGSLSLDSKEAFIFGDVISGSKSAAIYNFDNYSWRISSQASFNILSVRNQPIFYHSYDEPLNKTIDSKVMALTIGFTTSDNNWAENYYIEIYDPKIDEWVDLFQLPERITSISRLNEKEFLFTGSSNLYLFTYPTE